MANATNITVITPAIKGTAAVTWSQVTNGSSALTLNASVPSGGSIERMILMVKNDHTSIALGVSVAASPNLPAYMGTVAAIAKTQLTAGATMELGPFDRDLHNYNGALRVTFTPASGQLAFSAIGVGMPRYPRKTR